MDNRITGMTGHQENPGTGRTLQQQETGEIDLETLVRDLGIQHVLTVDAFEVDLIEKLSKNNDILRVWFGYPNVSFSALKFLQYRAQGTTISSMFATAPTISPYFSIVASRF
jgi:hypothetical protein